MAKAVSLSKQYTADEVRSFIKADTDVKYCRRLLAIASILDGTSRSEAAKIGGVQLQTLRDWVLRFNVQGPEGLRDRKAPGAEPKLNEEHQVALIKLLEDGPDLDKHGVVRWRCKDLVLWSKEELGVTLSEVTMGRVLKRLGYSHISARPRHYAQEAQVIEDFKKLP